MLGYIERRPNDVTRASATFLSLFIHVSIIFGRTTFVYVYIFFFDIKKSTMHLSLHFYMLSGGVN